LSKSERYFFDSEAMREESADSQGSAARYKSAFGGKKNEALLATDQVHTRPIGMREFDGKRNRRSVWTVNTKPYKGAHFATFPPDLIEPCILAGSRTGDIVLDPFMGSGTTAQVAQQLGRQWIGCELNPAYVELQKQRTEQHALELK
jgi:DNA modification methylase